MLDIKLKSTSEKSENSLGGTTFLQYNLAWEIDSGSYKEFPAIATRGLFMSMLI
jgi:hypothetical protein